eukprot:GGOE01027162.1.p8 GENE.GGOE01027162.1~~GGOE01027162.1.p8  ORF type:complete len:102 (+),score=2.34 GGOE01027162.1:523-828(+)
MQTHPGDPNRRHISPTPTPPLSRLHSTSGPPMGGHSPFTYRGERTVCFPIAAFLFFFGLELSAPLCGPPGIDSDAPALSLLRICRTSHRSISLCVPRALFL